MKPQPNIMIVTGEASGDLHGSNLVKALQHLNSELQFFGMGGVELAAAGVDLVFDAKRVSVVGIAEIFSNLDNILEGQKILRQQLAEKKPDLLIIIDLPDFNLLLAKRAKQLSIPVFYYICPQLWAWRSGRAKTIADRVNKAGVILPFEEQFLRARGVDATYVGHPLLDSVAAELDPTEFCLRHGIEEGVKRIALIPGSREKEISKLLPIFLEAAMILQEKCTEKIVFLLPLASTINKELLYQYGLNTYSALLDIRVIDEDRYSLMGASDSAVAASGTVTLELALLEVPMVVTYKVSPLSYTIGKTLIKVDNFSLVNLIAEEEVVPELLQTQVTPEAIAELIFTLTFDPVKRGKMLQGLATVRARLGTKGASERAAELVLEVLADQSGYD